jgi:hypothetical protein
MKKAQATAEYIILIGLVAAGFVAILIYFGRGFQGNVRKQAEQLGATPYAPGKTTINNWQKKTAHPVKSSGGTTTVKHGNMNETNMELDGEGGYRAQLAAKEAEIANLKLAWKAQMDTEGVGEADAARGDLGWAPPSSGTDMLGIGKQIQDAQDEIATLKGKIQASIDRWAKDRTKDETSSSSGSSESGTENITKHTDETLGNF